VGALYLSQLHNASSITVILFIIRILKDANFQPQIGLVTGTLKNCLSDLVCEPYYNSWDRNRAQHSTSAAYTTGTCVSPYNREHFKVSCHIIGTMLQEFKLVL
jgi:hypothetical protein